VRERTMLDVRHGVSLGARLLLSRVDDGRLTFRNVRGQDRRLALSCDRAKRSVSPGPDSDPCS